MASSQTVDDKTAMPANIVTSRGLLIVTTARSSSVARHGSQSTVPSEGAIGQGHRP